MDTAAIAAIIAALALVMNLVAHFLSGGWKLGQRLQEMEAGLRKAISEAKLEIELRQDDLRREVGETVAAVRQKIHEVELYSSHNYIRRESFNQVKAELSAEIKEVKAELSSEIKGVSDKLDLRLDRKRSE
jgi:hypothetical protein